MDPSNNNYTTSRFKARLVFALIEMWVRYQHTTLDLGPTRDTKELLMHFLWVPAWWNKKFRNNFFRRVEVAQGMRCGSVRWAEEGRVEMGGKVRELARQRY